MSNVFADGSMGFFKSGMLPIFLVSIRYLFYYIGLGRRR